MTDLPDSITIPAALDTPCAHCLERLDAQWQPPLYNGMDGYYLLTCVNPRCDLRGYTFSSNQYPPEDLFRYGVAS